MCLAVITLRDIATKTQLSLPTVSHILNPTGRRAHLFRADTQAEVRRVAAELGYRPNAAARSTATGRFQCVTLLLSTHSSRSLLPQGLLESIGEALAARGYRLMLAWLDDGRLTDDTYVPDILRQLSSDGLLVNYNAHIPTHMEELVEACRLPAVWINSRHPANCVHPDDRDAAERLTRLLLDQGHRRIAFVDYTYGTVAGSRHYSNPDRREGYAAAMRTAGRTPRFIESEGNIPAQARIAFTAKWLLAPNRPTAVVTYTGHELAAVLATADRRGLVLPRDLSVASFHDAPLRHFDLDVATALLPESAIGSRSVGLLLDQLAGIPSAATTPQAIPFDLHVGASIVAPPRPATRTTTPHRKARP